jgi:hypothetical protein
LDSSKNLGTAPTTEHGMLEDWSTILTKWNLGTAPTIKHGMLRDWSTSLPK